ncbi:MAG: RiPP maturation radical SAM C-methyltransferase [Planctomycetota bacterium]
MRVSPTESSSSARSTDVVLVVPPFQGLSCPALGVSQMKANLAAHGIAAEVLYLNLLLADRVGAELYEWLSGTGPALMGDMVFAGVAHDLRKGALERYVDDVVLGSPCEQQMARWMPGTSPLDGLRTLAQQAEEFVRHDAMDAILARDPVLVGFSSTFLAHCASLALARELKRRHPGVVTVMGGANCEMEMGEELLPNYPFLDHVGRGECDRTFVGLVRAVLAGGRVAGIDGFLSRGDPEPMPQSRPLQRPELDSMPYPDLADYFAQLTGARVREQIRPGLVAETSRGCWWGAKQHCTFCAFNRDGMAYRSKSPDRAIAEIRAQAQRYGEARMELTDNILDMAYFKSVVPALAEGPPMEFFWETKANLQRDQVQALARAGVRWIQPGIESLSDRTLTLMRKGSTRLQNVQLLKWCGESGVRVTWNWLFGFPGEDESELVELARTARALHHLQPPGAAPVLYLERFAPYQTDPTQWGLTDIHPARAYRHVYPLPEASLARMAFFLECRQLNEKQRGSAHRDLLAIVAEWQASAHDAHLVAVPRGDALVVFDTRPCATRFRHRLRGLRRSLYEHCWKIRGARDLQRAFASEATPQQIDDVLRWLVDQWLLLERDGRYLALALEPGPDYRAFPAVFPGGGVEARIGVATKRSARSLSPLRRLRLATVHAVLRAQSERTEPRQKPPPSIAHTGRS